MLNLPPTVRSLIDTGRENIESMLQSIGELAGAAIVFSGCYPGWKPDTSSPVMAIVKDTYESIYNKEPDIMAIHAGLECGLFKQYYPNLDGLDRLDHPLSAWPR